MYHIATYPFGSSGIEGEIGKEETRAMTSFGFGALFYWMLIFVVSKLLYIIVPMDAEACL